MFRSLKNRKAQTVMSEYVMIFFVILAMISVMTIYFRRAVQARMYDARHSMGDIITNRAGNNFNGVIYEGYEPYYFNTTTTTFRDVEGNTQLYGSGLTGNFRRSFNQLVNTQSISETAPPKDAQ